MGVVRLVKDGEDCLVDDETQTERYDELLANGWVREGDDPTTPRVLRRRPRKSEE
jgi:hypothetical protein